MSLFLHPGGLAAATSGAVFYGNAFCATWLFIKLSTRWKNLMKHWTKVELRLDRGFSTFSTNVKRFPALSAHILTAVILLLASGKYMLKKKRELSHDFECIFNAM